MMETVPTPEPEEVRAQIKRIVMSEMFASWGRLNRLLEYLADETLAGRATRLKEFTIAVDVFGKTDTFDPRIDSTVRSEVSKLRAKLQLYYDSVGQSDRVVIAIPKGGYTAHWETRPVMPPRRFPYRAALLILLMACAVVLLVWGLLRKPATRPHALHRLTNDAGLSDYPAISADGTLIAYASDRGSAANLDIWLQQVSGRDALHLTTNAADEYDPVFSPDNTLIAYRSDQDGGGVYIMPALGGSAQLLASQGRRPRFSPDGSHIAYFISTWRLYPWVAKSGLSFMVPVEGGAPKPIAPGFASAHYPIFTPDGRNILFLGRQDEQVIVDKSFDWWIVPVHGGAPLKTGILPYLKDHGLRPPTSEVPAVVLDAWSGMEVFFSARSSGDEANLWKLSLSPEGRPLAPPSRVTLGAGPEMHSSVARDARVVFGTSSPNYEIFMLPVDSVHGSMTGPLKQLTFNPAQDHWPSISAGGDRILFSSTRSGRYGFWLLDPRSLELSSIPAEPNLLPWGEIDSRGVTLLFYTEENRIRTAWRKPLSGGPSERLCQNCSTVVSRTRDFRQILLSTFEPSRIVRRNVETGEEADFLKHPNWGVYQAALSPDEKWVSFYARQAPELTRIYVAPWTEDTPVDVSQWIPITGGASHDTTPIWSPGGRILYFASDADGFNCIWAQRINPATGAPVGQAFAVSHFHAAGMRLGNVGAVFRAFGIAADKLVFPLVKRTGNIWLLQ